MKNFTRTIWVFLLAIGTAFGQQEKGIIGANNWLNNWTEFNPSKKEYSEATQILTGNITEDTKLYKKHVYLLLGSVFVTNNAVLSIEPGTVIMGDFESKASLTITRGASIDAHGLETDPIVFTSNRSVKRAGDWGGIIILGEAPINKFGDGSVASFYSQLDPASYQNTNYGGTNVNSNSGILRYVRIEYAGKKVKTAGNLNGLLLAGVGYATMLENIMVSYSEGNSFEILGGKVGLEKLVSYKSSGNDFRFNLGTQSKIKNSLAVRSPYVSGRNGSRCLQVVSYDKKEGIDFSKSGTSVVARNLTLVNYSDNIKDDIKQGLVKEAIFIGENTKLDINKSVISGFNPAVLLDDKIWINQENLDRIKFTDMYFNNCNGNIFTEYNSNNEDLENWYGNSAFFNVYHSNADNSETFIDLNNDRRPDFRLRINKIIALNDVNSED
ncbi:hypothetical protein A8C32_02450 [Flavivirga aquatica]|uniref:T9SS C-terminal target domain-containing protein n=1 Tax=Flavivirga aquatica TaxID=1849968 RepID=A0A1E5TAC4_9FLAO|nr:hypothetical protein [Flavivirga aquatica]OEK08332.1 hypothetical protein A8C32_02450 [Flavivirga aquatica]